MTLTKENWPLQVELCPTQDENQSMGYRCPDAALGTVVRWIGAQPGDAARDACG